MILTVVLVLAILALLLAIGSAIWRTPIWVAVILLAILEIIRALPVK